MTNLEYKERFIEACEQTLQEYTTRMSSNNGCALCNFDSRLAEEKNRVKVVCVDCISGQWGDDGCNMRRCIQHSRIFKRDETIAFWKATIKWLKGIPEEHWFEIGKNPRFAHVKKIDERIYKQFKKE